MDKALIRKLMKFSFAFFLSISITLLILIVLFLSMLFFTRVSVPDNPHRISENICIYFEKNRGSNEHILIFSYYCNSSPDWDIVMNPSIEHLHRYKDCYNGESWDIAGCALPRIWKEQGILDQVDTMECPRIKIKNKSIDVRQNKFCDWFAHDYPEPEYLKFVVSEEGKFSSEK
ncbi:hypothetical protein GF357_02495 [Candidatus Dojkabacteria bacterium]|nr:hypothetical protein [Candidatus Dojkabacteria bacterium]